LNYLTVHPDNQNQGIAMQLVAHGLEEAKKIGLDVYATAFPLGVGCAAV
jgi:predicted N-acetyltransferase YhbS